MTEITNYHISLIVGLGNPGKEYIKTRHNAGFMVIDKLLEALPGKFEENHSFSSLYWNGKYRGRKLFLQKPLTYMNMSGEAVNGLMKKKKLVADELLLIYDDIDLPLGTIRFRKCGGTGGHRGVDSVIEYLGSGDFSRLRIGIGRSESKKQKDYVLSEFSKVESDVFLKTVETVVAGIKTVLHRGLNTAMNEYNGLKTEIGLDN